MSLKAFLVSTSFTLVTASLPVLAQAQTTAPLAADKSPPFAVALPPAGALPPGGAPPAASQSPPSVAAAAPDATPTPPLPAAPVPPPLPPEAQYFYNDGGKPAGPINLADLQAKFAAGAITSSTLVWKINPTVAAKDLPDSSSSFGSTPAALTPAPIQPPAAAQPGATMANVRFLSGTGKPMDPAQRARRGSRKWCWTLAQDGSVLGTYTVSLSGTGAMVTIPVTGTWNATQLSSNMASMVLNLIVHATNGQQQSVNSTTTLQVIDQNTVRDITQGTITRRVTTKRFKQLIMAVSARAQYVHGSFS